jgi:hypothetical protein
VLCCQFGNKAQVCEARSPFVFSKWVVHYCLIKCDYNYFKYTLEKRNILKEAQA